MKKSIKRLVAVLVVMTMIVTMCSTAFAAGHGNKKSSQGSYKSYTKEVTEETTVSAPEEAVDTQASDENVSETYEATEDAISYPAFSDTQSANDIDVAVSVPEGALPEGTSLDVSEVASNEVEDAVAEVIDGEITDIAAVDISFVNNDSEVEPAEGTEVDVVITSPALKEGDVPSVVHIKNDGTAELMDAIIDQENGTATFKSGTFSTYTLAWTQGGQSRSATIHVGYLNSNNNNFTELDASAGQIDTSGDTIDLKAFAESVIPDNYAYIGARYSANANTGSVNEILGTTLTKNANGSWQAQVVTGDNNATTSTTIANNSHIYIFCEEKGAGGYTPPTPEGSSVNPETVAPNFLKTVTENTDGTYTIKLDITGHQAPVQEGQGANVIVVFDTTKSMRYNMAGTDPGSYSPTSTTTRMYAAKAALRTLVSTLKPGDGTGDTNLVNVAFIEFNNANNAPQPHSWGGGATWTSNQTTLNNYINGLTPVTGSGTNWENGFVSCENLLNTIPNNDNLKNNATYVIFVTDGDPNKCMEANLADYHYNSAAVAHAQDNANTVATKSYLYGVFCGASTGADRLETLITTASGEDTIAATSQADLEAAFQNIGEIITANLGSHNVNMDDGLPSLANIQHTVSGEATDFTYYKNGEVWEDAPEATYDATNGVVWDLESAGKLEDDTTYSIEFTIWPTQASYDLIADLNNGLRHYEAGYEDSISDVERAQIEQNADGTYTLKTNTHLYASYVNEADGETYNIPNVPYEGEHMPLPTEPISVKKIWPENMLDKYGAAAYRDPETGETKYATEIELTLQRAGEDYLDFVVSKDGPDGDPETTDDNWTKDDIFVSVGFMTVKDGVVDIKETGHDYQIVEPPEFLYYWDLISDVYHPMVINGTSTVLIYDPDLHEADPAKGIYEIPAESGRIYKTQTDTSGNTLEASNYRRSNLNLSKLIPEGADADSEFEYKVKVTDAYSTDGNVWFSAWDNEAGGLVTDTWVTGEGVVAQGDGYFYAPNGTELTMTIKTGWNVRFLNIYHGSTFSIEETGMPNNFEFDKIEATTQYDIMLESNKDWYTIETEGEGEAAVQTGKITGTITEPNNNYNITYTNKFKPQFYVYHSSDNTIECIQMGDQRIKDGKFDIAAETKSGYIYGGYYKAYGDTTSTDADIVAATYADGTVTYEYPNTHTGGSWATDSNGTPYTGKKATAWKKANAYTEKGTAMIPTAGTVYYLKEVPDSYFRPYIQVVYDTYHKNAAGENDNPLVGLYLLTATDDANYTDAGISYNNTEKTVGKLSATLKITDSNGKVTTLTTKGVFDGKQYDDKKAAVPRGYLTAIDLSSSIASVSEFTMRPYLKTLDGVKVYGVTERTVNTGDKTFIDDGNGVGKAPGITTIDVTDTAGHIKVYE